MSTITLHQPARTFQAIRWTGDNLRDVQDFMHPSSPLRNVHGERVSLHNDYQPTRLGVLVPDPISTKQYPSLGAQYKLTHAAMGDWILRTAGTHDFTVISNEQAKELGALDADTLPIIGIPAEAQVPAGAEYQPPVEEQEII